VSADVDDLRRSADKPSSIWLSENDDAVLLYKWDTWKGGVHYLRGQHEVGNLGSARDGGRSTFGNSVSSVRVSPFRLDLNIVLVERSDGTLPTMWRNRQKAVRDLEDTVKMANDFYRKQHVMLHLNARIRFGTSNTLYSHPKKLTSPSSWRMKGEIDVIVVNRLTDAIGRAPYPGRGSSIFMATGSDDNASYSKLSALDMAGVLVHELGHFLGLKHYPKVKINVMYEDTTRTIMGKNSHLTPMQICIMHDRLSRYSSRSIYRS
jgi:hypothetical protein